MIKVIVRDKFNLYNSGEIVKAALSKNRENRENREQE